MDDVSQISEFGKILIFLITGIILVGLLFVTNRLIAPNHPNFEKQTSYECGEKPTGSAWLPFNSRFYVIALVFLLFDVEMVFVFPWATVFGNRQIIELDERWGWISLAEMFIFLGILILGLAYVWRKGDLDWIVPKVVLPQTATQVPQSLYEKLNLEQSNFKVKDFSLQPIAPPSNPTPATSTAPATVPTTATAPATSTAPATAIKKPMFKPSFKKPGNDA